MGICDAPTLLTVERLYDGYGGEIEVDAVTQPVFGFVVYLLE